MMKCWLEEWMDFLFPVEVDMDGIELDPSIAEFCREVDGKPAETTDAYDWDAGFTLKIPGFYRAEPAVLEAGRIIKGCSIAHFITDGRVVR